MEALIEALMQALLELASAFLLRLLFVIVFFPVCCVLFTPIVLICACFGPGSYGAKVLSGYKGVCKGTLLNGVF